MDLTPNYDLKKPAGNEKANVVDLNYNADKIDTALHDLETKKYVKPSGGITKSDLSQPVQASLDRADNAATQEVLGELFTQAGQIMATVNVLTDDLTQHKDEKASKTAYGHVKIGNGINVANGVISVAEMIASNVTTTGGGNVQTEINNLKSSVSSGKISVKNAITDKGGVVLDVNGDGVPSFPELVDGVQGLSTPLYLSNPKLMARLRNHALTIKLLNPDGDFIDISYEGTKLTIYKKDYNNTILSSKVINYASSPSKQRYGLGVGKKYFYCRHEGLSNVATVEKYDFEGNVLKLITYPSSSQAMILNFVDSINGIDKNLVFERYGSALGGVYLKDGNGNTLLNASLSTNSSAIGMFGTPMAHSLAEDCYLLAGDELTTLVYFTTNWLSLNIASTPQELITIIANKENRRD